MRIYAIKKETGAKIEFLLLKREGLNTYEILAKPGKKVRVGTVVNFSDNLSAEILEERKEIGGKLVEFHLKEGTLESELEYPGQIKVNIIRETRASATAT